MPRQTIRRTTILGDDEIAAIVRRLEDLLPPAVVAASEKYGIRREDIVRIGSLAARCRESRGRLGLSIKDVASKLGVPQYRIKAVEEGRMREIDPAALRSYVALLGMQRWFARWRSVNRELATRIRIEPTSGDPKRTSRFSKRQG